MWQAIETAPQDGSRIDVWIARRTDSGLEGRREVDCYFFKGLWLDQHGNLLAYGNGIADRTWPGGVATHWMPVPPRPAA